MSFDPIVPVGGVAGYRLLVRTETTQRAVFDRQPEIARDVAYFQENIAKVTSAEQLVADRRLLTVALGAFGLGDEIDKKAFIRKILAEGTENREALANKFVDPRYGEIAKAFGFGNLAGARTGDPGFGQRITDAYRVRAFEIAVGEQDESLRLALNFRREIGKFANANDPVSTAWLSALGDQPVRAVLEGAFNLPAGFSQLDVDRQREELQRVALRDFGSKSMAVFNDPENVDKAINRYLIRKSIENGPSASTPGMAALSLLQGAVGPSAAQNLLLSNLG